MRLVTGLGGGIGCSYQDVCGAVSGGVLLIGHLFGRTRANDDDTKCMELATRYKERFSQHFGWARCKDLREHGYGSDNPIPCATLVEQAVPIFFDVIDEA